MMSAENQSRHSMQPRFRSGALMRTHAWIFLFFLGILTTGKTQGVGPNGLSITPSFSSAASWSSRSFQMWKGIILCVWATGLTDSSICSMILQSLSTVKRLLFAFIRVFTEFLTVFVMPSSCDICQLSRELPFPGTTITFAHFNHPLYWRLNWNSPSALMGVLLPYAYTWATHFTSWDRVDRVASVIYCICWNNGG